MSLPAPPGDVKVSAGSGRAHVARKAGVVALFTLASRVLGLVRDSVTAALFPRGATDAFFVAFTIPNVFRYLLAEGSLVIAFIPVFTEYRKRSEEEARRLAAATLGAALVVVGLVCLAGIALAPWIVRLFAEGFVADRERFDLTVWLTRAMFPYLLFVAVAALAMGVLNTLGHFSTPAASPVALNAVIIATVLCASTAMAALGLPPVTSLAAGVVLGGVAQVLLSLVPLARRGYLVWPRLELAHPGVRRIGRLMAPALFGLIVYQVNILLARRFASFLGEGAVSSLYYAQRLVELPMGLFAFSVATATTPELAVHVAEGQGERFKETFRESLALTLFMVIPASAALATLGVPICAVLFQRGRFDWSATRDTSAALVGFAAGMWAAAGVRATVPAFYAIGETRAPVRMALVGLVAYVASALVLRGPLGAPGLAFAVAIASAAQFAGLAAALRRRLGRLGMRALARSVARVLAASAVACAGAWAVSLAGRWEQGGALARNYVVLAAAVAAGVALYVAAASALGCPELARVREALRRRSG